MGKRDSISRFKPNICLGFARLAEEGSGTRDEVISLPLTSREIKRGLKAGM